MRGITSRHQTNISIDFRLVADIRTDIVADTVAVVAAAIADVDLSFDLNAFVLASGVDLGQLQTDIL